MKTWPSSDGATIRFSSSDISAFKEYSSFLWPLNFAVWVMEVKSISRTRESPVVRMAFLFVMNLISVTFLPDEKTPKRFFTFIVPIYMSLLVVSKTMIIPFKVPTTSRSPSRLYDTAEMTSLTSTQSTTVLCFIDQILVILSKEPIAKKSSLHGQKEMPVTTEGMIKM